MPTYKAPLRDFRFILNEVLEIDAYGNLPGFANADAETRDAILEEAGRLAEEIVQPLNRVGDVQGCTLNADASVTTPDGFKDAYRQMVEGGWTGLSSPEDYGGQGLPGVLSLALNEMISSACMAFGMYPGLTAAAAEALLHGGTDEQKTLYVPKLVSGEWTGTMNLTEPQCGTDLGLIRTKAAKQADGTYRISGQKIWISAGEHDFADNIIHLVLARIEGAPEGTKGLSLFVCPKFLPNADGAPGERNAVKCIGLEEKMGIHGNATCVMQYDGAKAWLVGEENKGLRIMFVMMNRARIGTGLQGLSQAAVAYQNAAQFARERLQGRAITGAQQPDKPADPIIVHPDVRRMLMEQKAFVEGARAFALYVGLHGDLEAKGADEAVRQKGGDYMALLTPIVKSFLTGEGFASVSQGMQVFGGAGYVEETGMAQFLRDCRITMIYEGANGIQALDLVGRKLGLDGGRPLGAFTAELDAFIAENAAADGMAPFVEALKTVKAQLNDGVTWLFENGLRDFNEGGAGGHDFLNLFGFTCLTYMWARMAKIALARQAEDAFYEEKLITGRYFVTHMLPRAGAHLAALKAGAADVMALAADAF
jgi:alkylation response protein AidB-like acyl-CoA dehydrogenase